MYTLSVANATDDIIDYSYKAERLPLSAFVIGCILCGPRHCVTESVQLQKQGMFSLPRVQ